MLHSVRVSSQLFLLLLCCNVFLFVSMVHIWKHVIATFLLHWHAYHTAYGTNKFHILALWPCVRLAVEFARFKFFVTYSLLAHIKLDSPEWALKVFWGICYNLLSTTFKCIVLVDVLATAAVFVGMTVRQVSLQRTVRSHRCVEVSRSPHFSLSTCLVFFWLVSFPWSTWMSSVLSTCSWLKK